MNKIFDFLNCLGFISEQFGDEELQVGTQRRLIKRLRTDRQTYRKEPEFLDKTQASIPG